MSFRFAVVDDAPFIRELLKQIVSQFGGHCIGEAESGTGALDIVRKSLPDVLFLDLVMPGRNGLEIIQELKSIWPELKVIACSTLDQETIIQRSIMGGVDDYITKPFTKEVIARSLEKLQLMKAEISHEWACDGI